MIHWYHGPMFPANLKTLIDTMTDDDLMRQATPAHAVATLAGWNIAYLFENAGSHSFAYTTPDGRVGIGEIVHTFDGSQPKPGLHDAWNGGEDWNTCYWDQMTVGVRRMILRYLSTSKPHSFADSMGYGRVWEFATVVDLYAWAVEATMHRFREGTQDSWSKNLGPVLINLTDTTLVNDTTHTMLALMSDDDYLLAQANWASDTITRCGREPTDVWFHNAVGTLLASQFRVTNGTVTKVVGRLRHGFRDPIPWNSAVENIVNQTRQSRRDAGETEPSLFYRPAVTRTQTIDLAHLYIPDTVTARALLAEALTETNEKTH